MWLCPDSADNMKEMCEKTNTRLSSVLVDTGCRVACDFGIATEIGPAFDVMMSVQKANNHSDAKEDELKRVPIPATYVVEKGTGIVVAEDCDSASMSSRMSADDIVKALDELASGSGGKYVSVEQADE